MADDEDFYEVCRECGRPTDIGFDLCEECESVFQDEEYDDWLTEQDDFENAYDRADYGYIDDGDYCE